MCYGTNIIIYHINVVTEPPRTIENLFSFKKYFIGIAKIYRPCNVLVNIYVNIFIVDLFTLN